MPGEKIFVVALILLVVFLGISVFLFYFERRLSSSEKKIQQLEKELNKDRKTQSQL